MPSTLTYPGVYVEEVPSGVRPIVGVSTSDTAFIDFFARGPLNHPVRVASLQEFNRIFGGLDTRSEASYAIAQYFVNGGSVAWIVRTAGGAPAVASIDLKSGANTILTLSAANEGVWGRALKVTVDTNTDPAGLFNVTVREFATETSTDVVRTETLRNLTMDATSKQYAVGVINSASALVTAERKSGAAATTNPSVMAETALSGGNDGSVPNATTDFDKALAALDQIAPAVFSLLCLPGATSLSDSNYIAVVGAATAYCTKHRAFLLVDVPASLDTADKMKTYRNDPAKFPATSPNSAVYFPRILVPDPLNSGILRNIAASGTVAGIYAKTDAARGVWKAPAGTDAVIVGAQLATKLDDDLNGTLNVLGVNVLRSFPIFGSIVWGARTTDGSDAKASEWKYLPVRRTALFIEESLYQGLKWVVFEPNDEPLWSQIRLNVGSFMNGLFRQGAFAGVTAREAYLVKCDKETTLQEDIDRGIVNIIVGFRPLKPAEFVVLKIQQMAGQTE
jgi:phage tail sheath protein FI